MEDVSNDIAEELARGYDDPLRFILWAFPWGETPELSIVPLQEPWASRYPGCKYGPDVWACEMLDEIGQQVRERKFDGVHAVKPIRHAVSSGHGIGKSFMTACLVIWIMATRPNCKGVVTANTASQLKTKTFAEISKWLRRSLVDSIFEIKAESIESKEQPEAWRVDAQTCREENSESFAGQHSASSTSFYIFDEASAVPDVIWEVAEGGLTDGEPMMFVFGNPTRNTGKFRDCFKPGSIWRTRQIDSRSVFITNKEELEEWRKVHGENSDFYRVRVKGEFPNQSTQQFIPSGLVEEAARRDLPHNQATAAVIGVDVARFGDDDSVIYTRIGRGWLPIKRYKGLSTTQLVSKVKAHYEEVRALGFSRDRIYINVDEGGVGGGPKDQLRDDGYPVRGIQFGAGADDPKTYARLRDEMWGRMKLWLMDGGTIPNDQSLIGDLTAPEYDILPGGQIKLEAKKDMKKRGLPSPDCFVEGTLILTPRGNVPIERIRAGDEVMTPTGPAKVLKVWDTRAESITAVGFSDGRVLVGKPAHGVVSNRYDKITRLDALSVGDEVATASLRELLAWNILNTLTIEGSGSTFKRQAGTTKAGTKRRRRDFYIDAFGWTTSELFRRACTSITSTATGLITGWRIWRLSVERLTSGSTHSATWGTQIGESEQSPVFGKDGMPLRNGTALTADASGIKSMGKKAGRAEPRLRPFARFAEKSSRLISRLGLGFALRRVSKKNRINGIKPQLGHALFAGSRLSLTSIGLKPVVVETVQTSSVPGTRVLNLTLDRENVYYANGVLVENCADALALTFAYKIEEYIPLAELAYRNRTSSRRDYDPFACLG